MALKKIRIGDATYDIGGTSISVENNNTLTITTAEKQEITDLTHTIWTLNPNAEGIELYYSNNEDDYSKLNYENPEDRTIIILGGEDVTNKDLISYLQLNATFVGFNSTSFGTITQIVIDDRPYDLGGSGSEIIEITGLDVLPEEYRDFNKLQHCWLRDDGSVYHLSYDKNYFECIDELEYKYIYINEDFEIERQYSKSIVTSDNLSNTLNSYATRSYVSNQLYSYVTNNTLWNDYMDRWETENTIDQKLRDQLKSRLSKKQDKLIPGDNITIAANGRISADTKLKCEVVDELPELTIESTKENKLYSYNGKLYHVIYDTSETHGRPLNLTNIYDVFPNPINGVSAAAVGTDIYIFGGYAFDESTGYGFYSDAIYKFDTITKNLTLLDITLDFDLEDSPAVTIGSDIYIIDNYSDVLRKFNTINQTFEDVELSGDAAWGGSGGTTATAIGTDIYIVSIDGDISKLDTVNLTAATVGSLDNGEDMGGCSVKAIGNILYIFGGFETNTIIKYDTTTNTATTLSATLNPDRFIDACSVVFDNKIIVLGGHDDEGTKFDTFYSFDPSDDSLTILDATLPDGGCKDGMAVVINNTELYVIAGDYSGVSSKNILEYSTIGREIVNIRYEQLTSSSSAGGTNVVPNPTLSGSETVLTGLTIDGTNYKIPSGGNSENGGVTIVTKTLTYDNDYNPVLPELFTEEEFNALLNADNAICKLVDSETGEHMTMHKVIGISDDTASGIIFTCVIDNNLSGEVVGISNIGTINTLLIMKYPGEGILHGLIEAEIPYIEVQTNSDSKMTGLRLQDKSYQIYTNETVVCSWTPSADDTFLTTTGSMGRSSDGTANVVTLTVNSGVQDYHGYPQLLVRNFSPLTSHTTPAAAAPTFMIAETGQGTDTGKKLELFYTPTWATESTSLFTATTTANLFNATQLTSATWYSLGVITIPQGQWSGKKSLSGLTIQANLTDNFGLTSETDGNLSINNVISFNLPAVGNKCIWQGVTPEFEMYQGMAAIDNVSVNSLPSGKVYKQTNMGSSYSWTASTSATAVRNPVCFKLMHAFGPEAGLANSTNNSKYYNYQYEATGSARLQNDWVRVTCNVDEDTIDLANVKVMSATNISIQLQR